MPAIGAADAIVVAAGSSRRMDGLDKLAWTVGGRPLLRHTLEAIAAAPSVASIVVVTAADRVEPMQAEPWLPTSVVAVVPGGARRQDSVRAGIRGARGPSAGSGRSADRPRPRRGAAVRRAPTSSTRSSRPWSDTGRPSRSCR